MDRKIKDLVQSLTGDDEYDCDGLEQNVLQLDSMLWNFIGVDK